MTQFKLAVKSKIQQARISMIENGHIQPSDDERAALAGALKTPVEDVFPNMEAQS